MTIRLRSRSPTACGCDRCVPWFPAVARKASLSRTKARADHRLPARDTIGIVHALHLQVEGNGDIAHRIHLLPVWSSQLFSGENGTALAVVGATPHRARPRSARWLAHPATGRCQ